MPAPIITNAARAGNAARADMAAVAGDVACIFCPFARVIAGADMLSQTRRACDLLESAASIFAERWPSGRRRAPGKCVCGEIRIEGSNPSLSAPPCGAHSSFFASCARFYGRGISRAVRPTAPNRAAQTRIDNQQTRKNQARASEKGEIENFPKTNAPSATAFIGMRKVTNIVLTAPAEASKR